MRVILASNSNTLLLCPCVLIPLRSILLLSPGPFLGLRSRQVTKPRLRLTRLQTK